MDTHGFPTLSDWSDERGRATEAEQHLAAAEAKLARIEAVHQQGGVKAPGYPQGWCTHDHHPWPCPTARILSEGVQS